MWQLVAAAHGKGELAQYYQKKLREGKPKMVILNAIRNKIVQRVYACIRDRRVYEKNYAKKLARTIEFPSLKERGSQSTCASHSSTRN